MKVNFQEKEHNDLINKVVNQSITSNAYFQRVSYQNKEVHYFQKRIKTYFQLKKIHTPNTEKLLNN